MEANLYPLLFEPVYKDYIWGGQKIPRLFNRETNLSECAESWEISDRNDGMSVVRNGHLRGSTLQELVKTMRHDLIGTIAGTDNFPLLIKLIDARERLSVQVHPNDETARRYGGEAKTEMWYVLQCEEKSKVFAELREGTTALEFQKSLDAGTVEQLLCEVPVIKDDAIYIPGGRVHAIAEGCLLLEIQQNSNTTYRVYDWGRVGKDGKPRELHKKQALEVINWEDKPPSPIKPHARSLSGTNYHWEIIKSPYFHMKRIDLNSTESFANDGQSFNIIFAMNGSVSIKAGTCTETVGSGTSCLLPAALKEYVISPVSKESSLAWISLI